MTCAPRCYRTVNTRLCLEKHMVTSPHSIEMPNMLYFTAVVFLSFFLHFSTPNIRGHWTDLNQTWTYIHLWLLFEQVCPNSPCHLPHSPALQSNMIATIEKNLVNLQGLPYMSPNLVNVGPETAENGCRVFAHPLNFRIGRHCQPYRMNVITDSRQTLPRVM